SIDPRGARAPARERGRAHGRKRPLPGGAHVALDGEPDARARGAFQRGVRGPHAGPQDLRLDPLALGGDRGAVRHARRGSPRCTRCAGARGAAAMTATTLALKSILPAPPDFEAL